MGYAKATSIIHAPVEAVWNALNDIDHTKDWVVGLEGAEITTPAPYGVGSIYKDYNRLGPILQTTAWHVTVFEPMTQQVHESKSAVLPSKMTLILVDEGQMTRLQMSVEYRFMPRLGFISRAFERLAMNRMLTQVLTQNQANLDAYLGESIPSLNSVVRYCVFLLATMQPLP